MKEDDQIRKEDDQEPRLRMVDKIKELQKTEDNPIQEQNKIQDLSRTVLRKVPDDSPPPPRTRVDMKRKLPGSVNLDSPMIDNVVTSGPRAQYSNTTRTTFNTEDKDNTFVRAPKSITVNGVDIMELQRSKQADKTSTSSTKKKINKITSKKEGHSTPSSDKITNYFVKKSSLTGRSEVQEDMNLHTEGRTQYSNDIQDNTAVLNVRMNKQKQEQNQDKLMKKTFNPILPLARMKDRIKSFEDRSNGVGCMIAGGRCGLHHCKVVREIVQKRMSSTDKFGNVVWKMGEGTILVCPAANKTCNNLLMTSQPGLSGAANKKLRIENGFEDNQPLSSSQNIVNNEDR